MTSIESSNISLDTSCQVSLYEGVELWLQNLQESVRRSLHSSISRAIEDVDSALPIEELAMRCFCLIC